jgi:hypothetical protein
VQLPVAATWQTGLTNSPSDNRKIARITRASRVTPPLGGAGFLGFRDMRVVSSMTTAHCVHEVEAAPIGTSREEDRMNSGAEGFLDWWSMATEPR